MKVILLQDIKGKGKKDQVVEVAAGFGMHLIREAKAIEANKGGVKIIARKAQDEEAKKAVLHEEALKNKTILERKPLEFKLKAGANGRVFKSVSSKQIVEKIKEVYDLKVDKRKIHTDIKINTLGVTNIDIELAKGVIATIQVAVKEI